MFLINFRLFCIQKFFFHTCIQRGSKKICHSSNFYNSYDLGKFQSIVSNSHKIQKRKAYKFVVFGHIQFQVGKLIINAKCSRFVLFISYAPVNLYFNCDDYISYATLPLVTLQAGNTQVLSSHDSNHKHSLLFLHRAGMQWWLPEWEL